MSSRLAVVALAALIAAGCAIPRWVPVLGKRTPKEPAVAQPPATPAPASTPAPLPASQAGVADDDETLVDRVVAVVNNDAITLGELQEAIAVYRQESRSRTGGPSDEQLRREFLGRIIDNRLQLQEAEREKIVVDDIEVNEELADRVKRLGGGSREDLEATLKAQGLSMDSVKKRVRDSLRVSKVVRRKVALRVSVTDAEIDRYFAENRSKLEAGLTYHARHILITPIGDQDIAWEQARIKAELIRSQLRDGAEFAALARQHSQDASARDGGDLGTLKRGELAQDIEERILALSTGEVSAPYRSSLGYHVFMLESKESLEGEAMQRARQQVGDILYREKYDARLRAWLNEIKERAIIEVRI
jgi:peptidyl-prolyl cis-trans isomerase SurA